MTFDLRSAQFRREREKSWADLEELLRRAERVGLRRLSFEDLRRLPTLYRLAVSSLSVARAISLDRNLLDYLTNLVSRAYVVVYATKQRPWTAITDFILRRFPRSVREFRLQLALALLLLGLGVLTGYLMTGADIEQYHHLVPQDLAAGRGPGTPTEELRAGLYSEENATARLHLFANFLFTHNAKIGLLSFALGFAAGIPVLFLLFYNGLVLGALAALYADRGLGAEFWAWVLPHGVTELLAVCLFGAGGLVLGSALLFPGMRSRLENLRDRGRTAALVALGAVAMLLVAAFLEGYFRQLVHSPGARWAVAGASAILWTLYFSRAGRHAGA